MMNASYLAMRIDKERKKERKTRSLWKMLKNVENYFDFEAKLFEAKLCVTDEFAKKIN